MLPLLPENGRRIIESQGGGVNRKGEFRTQNAEFRSALRYAICILHSAF
jgi:hypothetical protein